MNIASFFQTLRGRTIVLCLFLIIPAMLFGQDKAYTKRPRNEVRKGPGTYYPLVVVLPEGVLVKTFKMTDGWFNIQIPSDTSSSASSEWLSKNSLADQPPKNSAKHFDISSPNASPSSLAAAIRGFAVRFGKVSDVSLDSLNLLDQIYFDPDQYSRFKMEDPNLKSSFDYTQPEIGSNYQVVDSTETAFGLNVAARVAATELADNPLSTSYLNMLVTYLAEAAGAYDHPFIIHIIKGPRVTAVGLPGGYMFITTSLLDSCVDEAQLAGVLAHELTHILLKHGMTEVNKRLANIQADQAFSDLEKKTGHGNDTTDSRLNELAQAGFDEAMKPRLISYEEAADRGAVEILSRIGYDPQAVAEMILKIRNGAGEGTGVRDFNPMLKLDFQKRYDDLEKILRTMPTGGERNASRFNQFIRNR
ncbi:MAG TPA: M48 family metallopeptidase [Bacteroidota bacterium]|nr:M48 family metallopeptidase [Bacteroidota bacterium]